MFLHPLSSLAIAFVLTKILKTTSLPTKLSGLVKTILSKVQFLNNFVNKVKQFIAKHKSTKPVLIMLFYINIYIAVLLKNLLYKVIGYIYNLEPLGAADDFYMYDQNINPLYIPSFLVTDRTNQKPETVVENVLAQIGRNHRCSVKLVKVFGKYYFKKLSDKEYEDWKKTHTGVRYDITNSQQAIDFALKQKQMNCVNSKTSSV